MKILFTYLFIISIIIPIDAFSNSSGYLDSLLIQLVNSDSDTSKVNVYYKISKNYYNIHYNKSLEYAFKGFKLAKEINWDKGVGKMSSLIGILYNNTGDYNNAMLYYNRALQAFKAENKDYLTAVIQTNIGVLHQNTGNYELALNYYFKNLKLFKKNDDQYSYAKTLGYIAWAFLELNQPEKAREYYQKGLVVSRELNDSNCLSIHLGGIGNTYEKEKKYDLAKKYYERSLEIAEKIDYKRGITIMTGNIGMIFQNRNEFNKAEEYFKKAMKLSENMDDKPGIGNAYDNLGKNYFKMAQNTQSSDSAKSILINLAKDNLMKAAEIFSEIGQIHFLKVTYETLSDVFAEKNDFKNSLKYFKKYIDVKDSIMNIKSTVKIANLEAVRKNELYDSEIKHQRNQIYTISAAAALGILLLTGLIYVQNRRYKYKVKAENLLKRKNEEIRKANRKITDSINYAQGIQAAVLPFHSRIREFFKDYFVLFIPKDVVSGDFYWIERVNDKIIAAVVDCTGHGVPGALMSMMGNELLNNIVIKQKIFDPAKILEEMNKDVRYALKQEESVSTSTDGMDVCICIIERNKGILKFAGAKRPLYIVSDGEFIEIKGDRKSVGGRQKEQHRFFTSHEIEIKSGMILYLTTDGYQDQHNQNQEKIGVRQLRKFLLFISDKPLLEQKKLLQNEIKEFSKGEKIRDDMTILGIKL